SDGASERVGEVAERLRAQEGVVPALAPLDLEELLAAEPRDFRRDLLEGARRRVECVVQRVAREARRDAADRAGPLLEPDRRRRIETEAADLRLLDPVVAADPDLLERETPERGVPPGRDRIAELRPGAGAAPVEVVEVELPVEGVEPGRERGVPEVGLGERQDDVAADRADVARETDALAAPEEVDLL